MISRIISIGLGLSAGLFAITASAQPAAPQSAGTASDDGFWPQ